MALYPSDRSKIIEVFGRLQHEVHGLAKEKGWHDESRSVPEALCLVHSELSEALEEYRQSRNDEDLKRVVEDDSGKPEGFSVELGDAIIRILDLAGALGLDLAGAVLQKHTFNMIRPHRHGNKRC